MLNYLIDNNLLEVAVIVVTVIVTVFLCVIIVTVRKRRAEGDLAAASGAATVFLFKKRVGDNDWADMNLVLEVDGKKVHSFIYKLGINACYVGPGKHTLTVQSKWARRKSGHITEYTAGPRTLLATIESDGMYSLEYHIPQDEFVFEKYENERLKKKPI